MSSVEEAGREPIAASREWVCGLLGHGERPALLDPTTGPEGARTFHALAAAATSRGDDLNLAASPGPVVIAVRAPLLFAECVLAALARDRTVFPVSPALPEREVERLAAYAGATLLVTEIGSGPAATTLRGPARANPLTALLAAEPGRWPLLLATEGPSGGVRLVLRSRPALEGMHARLRETYGLDRDDLVVGIVPFHLSFGFEGVLHFCLSAGVSLLPYPSLLGSGRTEIYVDAGATAIFASPPFFRILASAWRDGAPRGAIRHLFSGGGPLPVETVDAIRSLSGLTVRSIYGTTETACLAVSPPSTFAGAGYAGRLLRGIEVRPALSTAPFGPGVAVNAALSFRRVEDEPSLVFDLDATGENPGPVACSDGFVTTRDVGRITSSGDVFLADGADAGRINFGGAKIDPREVEAVLRAVPGVESAEVVAVPSATFGSVAHARVRVSSVGGPTEAELRASLALRLPAWKIPRSFAISTASGSSAPCGESRP